MKKSVCLVGNSSAFIREGAYIGTPTVNIGSRQEGRDRVGSLIDVGYKRAGIIYKNLEDKEWAKTVYAKAEECANSNDDYRNLAKKIYEAIHDNDNT